MNVKNCGLCNQPLSIASNHKNNQEDIVDIPGLSLCHRGCAEVVRLISETQNYSASEGESWTAKDFGGVWRKPAKNREQIKL